jgi:TRAP-type C4-dicarboxylate transport system substrate-binding protein
MQRQLRAFAAAAAILFTVPATAQEVTLKIHHFLPPPSVAHSKFIVPWTQRVEAACPGRIKFQLFPSMQLGGTPPQLFDQARDGVVDIAWTVLGYTAGRYPASEVFELPFMTRHAEGSSRALWEYSVANGLMSTEFKDVKVLALHVHDEGYIHTRNSQIKVLADFKGKKMRGPTRLTTRMLGVFGATPVGMPVPQVPEAINKGVIDGAIVPWEIVPALKLHELVRYHTETDPAFPALYTATFIFAMNRGSYDKLPPDAKKCLDANTGAELSQWIGKVWDESAVGARKLAEARGNTFYTVPAAELATWQKAAQPVVDDWIKEVGAKGLNGQALLQSARDFIKKYDK